MLIWVTGPKAVAQPSWRGIPRSSARPPAYALMQLSGQLQTALLPPGEHLPPALPGGCWPARTCGDQHRIRRRGPHKVPPKPDASLVTREGDQGAGEMLAAIQQASAVRPAQPREFGAASIQPPVSREIQHPMQERPATGDAARTPRWGPGRRGLWAGHPD